VVTSIPLAQIKELFELRALLESDLLGRAIPQMTEASLAESATILRQLEEAYHAKNVAMWGQLNWAFHRSLYLPAGRVQTMAVVQGINLQTDRYIRLQLLVTGDLADAEGEHREILRLCHAGDVPAATAFLNAHILTAAAHLIQALEAHQQG